MWSSLKKLIRSHQDRAIVIEEGEPRYVILSIEEYRRLVDSQLQEKTERAEHAWQQINDAFQEARPATPKSEEGADSNDVTYEIAKVQSEEIAQGKERILDEMSQEREEEPPQTALRIEDF